MDPIAQAILEILGAEIAGRVLRPESQALPGPADEPFRQGPPAQAFPSEVTLRHDMLQGPPCDVVDALMEQQLFDYLMEDDDACCT